MHMPNAATAHLIEPEQLPLCAVCGEPFAHGCNTGVCSLACLESTPTVTLMDGELVCAACATPLTLHFHDNRGPFAAHIDTVDDCDSDGDDFVCACGSPLLRRDLEATVRWLGEE